MNPESLPIFAKQSEGRALIRKACRSYHIPIDLLVELVRVELEHTGKARRHGIFEQFDEIFEDFIERSTAPEVSADSV